LLYAIVGILGGIFLIIFSYFLADAIASGVNSSKIRYWKTLQKESGVACKRLTELAEKQALTLKNLETELTKIKEDL